MKYILAGIIVIMLSSVSPTLGAIAFFVVPIILYFITKEEEKQQDISKYDWSARYERWEDVSPERQAKIAARKRAEEIEKEEKLLQQTRKSNEILAAKRAISDPDSLINTLSLGFNNTLPTLETFQKYSFELPFKLGNKLMDAAKRESIASATVKKGSPAVEFEEQMAAIRHLDEVVKEVNAYKAQQKKNQEKEKSDNRKVDENALPADDLLD